MRADLRSDRRTKLQFQGAGAHPWVLERPNGLARGIYNRLVAHDCSSGEQIPADAQWRLNALIHAGGDSAYRLVFASNPAGLFGRGGKDGDLLPAQDASPSGQFAQQWELRGTAREMPVKEVANSKSQRLPAYNKSF